MAAGKPKRRGGGDWVMGGPQLFGVFVLLVVMFGAVFTLGYLLGRSQLDQQFHADASSVPVKPDGAAGKAGKSSRDARDAAEKTPDAGPAAPAPEWDFYRSAQPEKPGVVGPESPKAIVPNGSDVPAAVKSTPAIDSPRSNLKSVSPPAIPKGATLLQIAAMSRQGDAVALARALQQKRFPAFVLPPSAADHYYRVDIGPYADSQSADLARQKLESQGFKAITRR